MNNDPTIIYRIDAQDRIVFVNDGWKQHAESNGYNDFDSGDILFQSLWDSISDDASRQIYREILENVRLNKSVVFPFRCDSPECRLFLEMQIEAHGDEVQFETRVLKTEQRPAQKILDSEISRSDEMLRICGWCKKIDVGQDNWKEVEIAVSELGLFKQEKLPQLTHGICPECFRSVKKQITAKRDVKDRLNEE